MQYLKKPASYNQVEWRNTLAIWQLIALLAAIFLGLCDLVIVGAVVWSFPKYNPLSNVSYLFGELAVIGVPTIMFLVAVMAYRLVVRSKSV